jgi:Mg-chelatase subunit ChlD
LKQSIERDINDGGRTFIGSGLQMGIQILNNRQTINPLSALLLLTDGQDNRNMIILN